MMVLLYEWGKVGGVRRVLGAHVTWQGVARADWGL